MPVSFAFGDVDEDLSWATDVAGPFALVIRGLLEQEREAIREPLAEAFAPFTTNRAEMGRTARNGGPQRTRAD